MPDREPQSLNTRWSMLDGLQGPDAENSWHWFVERYRPFVRSCLFRILGADRSEAACEEVWSFLYTSDVFAKADRSRRFRAFLTGVVRNFARKWQQQNWHPQSDTADDGLTGVPATTELSENEETRLFARQVLHLAMAELTRTHEANAKALHWFYGIPEEVEAEFHEPVRVSEIARRLDIVPNATHQVLHKGRQRLRALIESELRETVRDSGDLEEELTLIFEAVGRESRGLLE